MRVFLTLGIGVVLVSAVRASRQAVIPLWSDHLMRAPSMASLIYGLAGGIDMLVFAATGLIAFAAALTESLTDHLNPAFEITGCGSIPCRKHGNIL
ncbi:hypothetical protein [Variovorax boronicumulans]|uniref:hypothetical protein n=1 Tax=Variovorax boronicumulans TaxID=436515 RepID=UPI0034974816